MHLPLLDMDLALVVMHLKACENDEEFNELKEDIINSIVWGTKQDVLDYVTNQEANRWYFHEEDWVEIRKEIMEILK
jgi:hypothetical protein